MLYTGLLASNRDEILSELKRLNIEVNEPPKEEFDVRLPPNSLNDECVDWKLNEDALERRYLESVGPEISEFENKQPPVLPDGGGWGLVEATCERSGYNLSSYACRAVTFTCFPTDRTIQIDKNHTEPLELWTISSEGKILCIYLSVSELTPGIFPAELLKYDNLQEFTLRYYNE
jgi:hypothetical protein